MEDQIGMAATTVDFLDKLGFWKFIVCGLGISIFGYMLVLIFGAMLGLVSYYKTKNGIALAAMLLGNSFVVFVVSKDNTLPTKIIDFSLNMALGVVVYVGFWMAFRSRIDTLQDKFFAKDNPKFFSKDFEKPSKKRRSATRKAARRKTTKK